MRKLNLFIATVFSIFALSATAFAADGWTNNAGTWQYYENDKQVCNAWRQSGDDWFYLDMRGEIAKDTLAENNGDIYALDKNGMIVKNMWRDFKDSKGVFRKMFFGNDGKAYQSAPDKPVFFEIDGHFYFFDSDGYMQYGWIDKNGKMVESDEPWTEGVYYCGRADEGAVVVSSWRKLPPIANEDEDDIEQYWFYFSSNGEKIHGTSEHNTVITLDGKKFEFDEYGRLIEDVKQGIKGRYWKK